MTGTAPTAAFVRVVQAISDASGGVDLAFNGTVAVNGAPFGSYTPAASGTYARAPVKPQLTLSATGSTTPFYDKPASTLAANAPYTIVALGRLTPGAAPAATATVLADTTTAANGAVLVRVFNALSYIDAPTGSKVDVYVYPQGAQRPSAPDATALAFNAAAPYLTRTGGNFIIDVFQAGAPSDRPPLFSASFAGGPAAVRTVILLDPVATAQPGTSAYVGSALVLSDQN
ncbi:MAG TPA: DUF4397 domain-containing protein [Gemmatirosa sp.]